MNRERDSVIIKVTTSHGNTRIYVDDTMVFFKWHEFEWVGNRWAAKMIKKIIKQRS